MHCMLLEATLCWRMAFITVQNSTHHRSVHHAHAGRVAGIIRAALSRTTSLACLQMDTLLV